MKQYNLILNNPATEWENRTPIGCGSLGAMIEGYPSRESIQLNEEKIWAGSKIEIDSPDFRAKIDRTRELLAEGRAVEADEYAVKEFASDFHRVKSYETAGELLLNFGGGDECENYSRVLDLNKGIAEVKYTSNGTTCTREYFASYPAKLIAVRVKSDNLPLDIDASLFRKNLTSRAVGDTISASGAPLIEGRPFTMAVKFVPDCGDMYCEGSMVKIRGAKKCDIFISIVTDGQAEIPHNVDYDALKAEHIADFTALMERSDITLPDSGADESRPVNERLAAIKENEKPDNKLVELYYQFGKYLLVSSSRSGTLPANLQGVWN